MDGHCSLPTHCPRPGEHSVPGHPASFGPLLHHAMQPRLLRAAPEDALTCPLSTCWQTGFEQHLKAPLQSRGGRGHGWQLHQDRCRQRLPCRLEQTLPSASPNGPPYTAEALCPQLVPSPLQTSRSCPISRTAPDQPPSTLAPSHPIRLYPDQG